MLKDDRIKKCFVSVRASKTMCVRVFRCSGQGIARDLPEQVTRTAIANLRRSPWPNITVRILMKIMKNSLIEELALRLMVNLPQRLGKSKFVVGKSKTWSFQDFSS